MGGSANSEVAERRRSPMDIYPLIRNATFGIAAVFILIWLTSLIWYYAFADDGLYCAVGQLTTGGFGAVVALVVGVFGLVMLAIKPRDGAIMCVLGFAIPALPYLLGLIMGVGPHCG